MQDVRKAGQMGWCGACLTLDKRGLYVSKLHTDGMGPSNCALGKGSFVYRVCMYLYKEKIGVVNKIMGPRLKFRQCFMKSNTILAESEGPLGIVKPDKKDYVKWLHGAWKEGGPLSNAAVLFVGYFHYFKEGEVLSEDKDVWETLMSVPE